MHQLEEVEQNAQQQDEEGEHSGKLSLVNAMETLEMLSHHLELVADSSPIKIVRWLLRKGYDLNFNLSYQNCFEDVSQLYQERISFSFCILQFQIR